MKQETKVNDNHETNDKQITVARLNETKRDN